jgi:hypothetical protein
MNEEESHIADGQYVQPSESQWKALMRSQDPSTDAGQGHLKHHKLRLPAIDRDSHEWVRLATAILDEEQCEEGIEHRGPYDDEQQRDRTLRGAINIGPVILSSPAETLTSPVVSQDTQERCGMCTTVK